MGTVEFRKAPMGLVPIDYDGVHLVLEGTLAFFYNFFRINADEDTARRELAPWLMDAKAEELKLRELAAEEMMKRKAAADASQLAAQSLA